LKNHFDFFAIWQNIDVFYSVSFGVQAGIALDCLLLDSLIAFYQKSY